MRFSVCPYPIGALVGVVGACMLFTISCTTVHPITSDDLTGPNPPHQVKVTLADDRSVVVLHDPHVTGDTLVGSAKGARRTILLSDVYGMTDKQTSTGKTALLVLGEGRGGFVHRGDPVEWRPARRGAAMLPGMQLFSGL